MAKDITMGVASLPIASELPFVRSMNKAQVLNQIYESLFYVNDKGVFQSNFFENWTLDVNVPDPDLIWTPNSRGLYGNNV
jgi:hypothetical protein